VHVPFFQRFGNEKCGFREREGHSTTFFTQILS
jgi:hypothetical protein